MPTYGQEVKKQLFFGTATKTGLNGASSSTSFGPGFSLAIPVSEKVFIRPITGVNFVNPTSSDQQVFTMVYTTGLVGLKLTKVFSILGGGGHSFIFKENEHASHSNALVISTSAVLNDRLILFTPVAINKKGVATNIQIGYYW